MMIVRYNVNHRFHPQPIELCGLFRDLEHFEAFNKTEEFRGWKMVGKPKILSDQRTVITADEIYGPLTNREANNG